MLDKIPTPVILLVLLGFALAMPVVVIAFLMGGTTAALIALAVIWAAGVAIYMIAGRKYGA